MKKNLIFSVITLCTFMFLFGQKSLGQIIANHSIVDDYDKIPQQYIDSVKKMRLIIAGESHSAAYRDGLLELEKINSKYAVDIEDWGTPQSYTDQYLRASDMTWGDVDNASGWNHGYGEEDWFTSATAISRTKAGIAYCHNHNYTMSAFGFGWCWDSHIGVTQMNTYLSATKEYMSYCISNNIPTKIIFTTGPVDGYSEEDGYNNFLRWQKVRDYVDTIANAILFDYADILCWDDNGVQTTETWNGHTFSNISDNSLNGNGTGHIGMNGAVRIAKAMWWMLARIAGWNGLTTPSTATDIATFSIPGQVSSSVNATNHTVAVTMPYGTNLTSLTPTITVSAGATINPTSGTARNFTSAVTYTVTAQDGSTTQDWTVTVATAAPLTGTDITAFTIPNQKGNSIISTANHTVAVTMPYGTNLTSLTPTITVSAGATINPTSGTARNFTSALTYTVAAQDGSTTQDWTVTVTTAAPLTGTDITTFSIPGQTGSSVISTSSHTVSVVMPYGTSLTSLTPTIAVSAGATINPTSGTPRNFTAPVTYTVTAQNGTTTQNWTVTVTAAPSTANDINTFTIPGQTGNSVISATNHNVSVVMPNGTSLTSLTPTITVSAGATINPTSGTPRNFTAPVTYTVTAQNGTTTQNWTVTVTAAPSTANDITTFTIPGQTGNSVISTSSHTVSVVMPNGTSLTSLTPTITVSAGATISPTSGTSRNFTAPVTYTVKAQNGTTQNWTVSVTAAPSTANDINAFSIPGQTGSSVISTSNHTVSVVMPNGTSLTSLTPTITVSTGATITPTSGTARNFNSPVTYTVTAQNGTTTQNWTVTVTAAPSKIADILTFAIPDQVSSTIDTINHTITVVMPNGGDITNLTPIITVSAGASVDPESGEPKNFSSPVTYIVTAEDKQTTQNWIVTVSVENVTGINEFNKQNSLTVYPNPSVDYCNISINCENNESYIIKIQDISGKVVYESAQQLGPNTITIPVDKLKQGVYYLTRTDKTSVIDFTKLIIN